MFYRNTTRMFVIHKRNGGHRPASKLLTLNNFIQAPHFNMETIQQVVKLVQPLDYKTSIELSDAFLHVLVHHHSSRYLRFLWEDQNRSNPEQPPVWTIRHALALHMTHQTDPFLGPLPGYSNFGVLGRLDHDGRPPQEATLDTNKFPKPPRIARLAGEYHIFNQLRSWITSVFAWTPRQS